MNIDLILKYFPEISSEQIRQFQLLHPLYTEWNSKINVVSRKDIDSLYLHHVLHSLSIAKFINFENETRVLDLGTGGGFPGIPLAIFFPQVQFTLCDSIGKKIKVVTEVSKSLGLNNVNPIWTRAENIDENFDYIVSRAVTELNNFIPLIKGKFKKGIILLKGGNTEQEISNCQYKHLYFHTEDINLWFEEEYFNEKKIILVK